MPQGTHLLMGSQYVLRVRGFSLCKVSVFILIVSILAGPLISAGDTIKHVHKQLAKIRFQEILLSKKKLDYDLTL